MTAGGPGSLVVDTHTAVWYLYQDPQTAEGAVDHALQAGNEAYVASISLVELTYLVLAEQSLRGDERQAGDRTPHLGPHEHAPEDPFAPR